MHHDDASLHDERIKLWNDFNHGWLALAFQQKQLMASGQQISSSQKLMTRSQIEEMGDELVRLCDGLERHGLVDYQYGVWEEQIEAGTSYLGRRVNSPWQKLTPRPCKIVLEECLDLFPK
jgi:hypothetical protein